MTCPPTPTGSTRRRRFSDRRSGPRSGTDPPVGLPSRCRRRPGSRRIKYAQSFGVRVGELPQRRQVRADSFEPVDRCRLGCLLAVWWVDGADDDVRVGAAHAERAHAGVAGRAAVRPGRQLGRAGRCRCRRGRCAGSGSRKCTSGGTCAACAGTAAPSAGPPHRPPPPGARGWSSPRRRAAGRPVALARPSAAPAPPSRSGRPARYPCRAPPP